MVTLFPAQINDFPPENAFFSLLDICKTFRTKKTETAVLRGVNLSVREHEFVSIVGPSGCGKSTLLKIAGGIMSATSGSIRLKDETFFKYLPKEKLRDFGFVFQHDNLFAWRTCEKNLRLPLEVMKLKGPKWDARIYELLRLVGLEKYRTMYPHEMSGGMRQRASIARALVHNPSILILDQPFGALDAITRRILAFELLNIWKTTRKTILFVTNNVEEALLLSGRVCVLAHGHSGIFREIAVDIPEEERTPDLLGKDSFIRHVEELDGLLRSL
ncbi:MAG: ABC transporter ATP-binding protein [Treponema sp.]|jgi:NitT/TauT family transport system ATP-binding protein|nr:ABC transporter ATP-binding protein [Treponema sp.]